MRRSKIIIVLVTGLLLWCASAVQPFSFQLKMDINWKACARTSNSLLSFHAPPIHFMRLYVAKADAWDAFLSVSFIFAIVPIDA